MMIVMKEDATKEQVDSVVKRVESVGALAHISEGEVLTVIGAIGERELLATLPLAMEIREQADSGRPTVAADPDGVLARSYRDGARHLAARLWQISRAAAAAPRISMSDD